MQLMEGTIMKKIITALLLLSIIISLASCGEKEKVPDFPYISDEGEAASSEDKAQDVSIEVETTHVSLSQKAFTLYVIKGENDSYAVKAVVPAGVTSGKIVVTASKSLELKEGTLKTMGANAVANEKYDRDGIKGACTVFASARAFPENAVVFEAEYIAVKGMAVSDKDFTVNLWNLVVDKDTVGDQDTQQVVIKYVD